ncbi:MAG: choice-of-anchor E domain-containing protein [Phycisphaerales bacterium]|nr:choice-of-anchor E domain-containing protein [Phycisphaerales bacterium]
MKKTISLIVVMAGLGLGHDASRGDTINQFVDYDFSLGNPAPVLQIDAFDTMGGQRNLTGVRIDLEGSVILGAYAENLGNSPITDWTLFLDAGFGIDVGALSIPLDGNSFPALTADLAATDNIELSGPDYIEFEPEFAPLDASVNIAPGDLGVFIGTGLLDIETVPVALAAPGPGFVAFGLNTHDQSGGLFFTYEFEVVPEPASLSLLLMGFLAIRTRRAR